MGSFSYAMKWENEVRGGASWRAPRDESVAMEEGLGRGAKAFSLANTGSAGHEEAEDGDTRRRMS